MSRTPGPWLALSAVVKSLELRLFFRNPGRALKLILAISAGLGLSSPASAGEKLRGSTFYFGGTSYDDLPRALQARSSPGTHANSQQSSIALTLSPAEEASFFESLDSFLEADTNIHSLHETYFRALMPFQTYHTFYIHSRDTRQVRMHTVEEELVLRREMARQLRNYLLVRGIPKFLTTREETKIIGERYQTLVGQTEKLTKINIRSEDKKEEFSLGLNPFTAKTWIKWVKNDYYTELSRYLFRANSTVLTARKRFSNFYVGSYYYFELKQLEPYYLEELSKSLTFQTGVIIPLASLDVLADLSTFIRYTYKF